MPHRAGIYTERHKFLRISLERRSLGVGIVASISDRRRRSETAATAECANICVALYSTAASLLRALCREAAVPTRSCRKLEFELYADLSDSRILIHGAHGAKPAVCGRRVRTGPSIRMVKSIQELGPEVNMHAFPN